MPLFAIPQEAEVVPEVGEVVDVAGAELVGLAVGAGGEGLVAAGGSATPASGNSILRSVES